ncbi:MAG: hypothetical protein MZW92_45910 [Comamonadaceae bacterium]|nr:hypothetical protein [Comamonadaceae bacterium]
MHCDDALCKTRSCSFPARTRSRGRMLTVRCCGAACSAGSQLVDPASARTHRRPVRSSFVLVAWNALFYGQVKGRRRGPCPGSRRSCHKTGPDAADVREALSWRHKLRAARSTWWPTTCRALIPLLPDPAVKSAVVESERYFHDHDGIGAQVREAVKAPLREMLAAGDRILLIGHGMGIDHRLRCAVVSSTRSSTTPARIDLLLTLGSPLGMHYVQDQLLGFP